jgi:hypothetical protein
MRVLILPLLVHLHVGQVVVEAFAMAYKLHYLHIYCMSEFD